MGISLSTLTDTARHLVQEVFDSSKRIRRRAYQPLMMMDLFIKQLEKTKPQFATFYTNHVAAAMHRYWGATFPEDYGSHPMEDVWIRRYSSEIWFAMDKLDLMIARLRNFVDADDSYTLVVASSMGQAAIPAQSTADFLTITDIERFMQSMGVPKGSWEQRPAMVPCCCVVVSDSSRDVFINNIAVNAANAQRVAGAIGGLALTADICDTGSLTAALDAAEAAHGTARMVMNIAGIGTAKRVVGKDGQPAPLEDFERVIRVNLVGTYNVVRLTAARLGKLVPLPGGERGVMLMTASVAAYDGQVGQEAYSASKGGIVGMTLPLARDLAQHGVRVCTIAPGLFATPLMRQLPEPVQQSLAASIPFPPRLGQPEEFAALAAHIVTNGHLNGEVIRLDGALRMAPR